MPNNFSPIAFSFTFVGITVGFSFVGLPLILLAFALYWIVSLFDIGTRVYIERKKSNVSSEGFGKGLLKRVSNSILMLTIFVIFGHIHYSFGSIDGGISTMTGLIPAGVVALFLAEEVISLIENSIEINGDSKVLISLKKILGLGLEKALKKAEEKVEEKTSPTR